MTLVIFIEKLKIIYNDEIKCKFFERKEGPAWSASVLQKMKNDELCGGELRKFLKTRGIQEDMDPLNVNVDQNFYFPKKNPRGPWTSSATVDQNFYFSRKKKKSLQLIIKIINLNYH